MFMASQIGQTPGAAESHPPTVRPGPGHSLTPGLCPAPGGLVDLLSFSSWFLGKELLLSISRHRRQHGNHMWKMDRPEITRAQCSRHQEAALGDARGQERVLSSVDREARICTGLQQNLRSWGQGLAPLHFRPFDNPTQPPFLLSCPLHVYNTLGWQLFCFNKLLHMKNLEQGLQLMCSHTFSPATVSPNMIL